MPLKSNWDHINVPLPELFYENTTTRGQGKGSTTWAAHSHTPVGVELWDDFDNLVTAEGREPCNHEQQDIDFVDVLSHTRLPPVSREEDVTNRLETILDVFSDAGWNLSGGIKFPQHNQQIIGKPDIVAQERNDAALGVGPISAYSSPPPGRRAQARRDNTATIVSLYRMPFETKPIWKFSFLDTSQFIIDEWEVPEDFDSTKMQSEVPLPKSWSVQKKKVFHLVRHFYGQMVVDKRRYGVFHMYERCFFCKRTPDGILRISRAFEKEESSPSIFQAIKTMVAFSDHRLDSVRVHPSYASKAPPKKKNRRNNDDDESDGNQSLHPGGIGKPVGSGGARKEVGSVAGGTNLAASLQPWDCDVYDCTDHVLLLTTTKEPSVIVKLQSNPQMKHVADEMANEAAMYEAMEGNHTTREVIPRFHGHSRHLGVAMTCIEKELDDFYDIGLENLSDALKRSAVRAVQVLSDAGILHNDIELRNIVQSKKDRDCAQIIDLGRASFSSDSKRLKEQVEWVKKLLNYTT
eukprot:scaffold6064_cov173-Amphora_coffeaeformis.AAC.10